MNGHERMEYGFDCPCCKSLLRLPWQNIKPGKRLTCTSCDQSFVLTETCIPRIVEETSHDGSSTIWRDGRKFRRNEPDKKLILFMVRLRKKGYSLRAICDALTRAGVEPRGRQWHPQTVKNMLSRNVVVGNTVYTEVRQPTGGWISREGSRVASHLQPGN